MLICHVSDTHSYFPSLPKEAEIIIHSGDLCPNLTRGDRKIEVPYQSKWIIDKSATFKDWIEDRPFLFCAGNHDFIDPTPLLQKAGINAINLTNQSYQYKGIKFYGFPYIPWICGEWNYECHHPEMNREIRRLRDVLLSGIDVLVTHCPPYGVLDANVVLRDGKTMIVPSWAESCGNTQLTNLLTYDLEDLSIESRPKYLLCGHIHESHSIVTDILGMTISNAATTVHLIDLIFEKLLNVKR